MTAPIIINGNRTIVTVDQGCVGFCTDRGEPVLLPPGMHQWNSSTLLFVKTIQLDEPVINLGPWTLLTINQGYMAVTQDNGKQVILEGGSVYLLTRETTICETIFILLFYFLLTFCPSFFFVDRNWKFEKFVSTKIQTDELNRIEAASADNVIMHVDATVLWRVSDVDTAVTMSVKTMNSDGTRAQQDTTKLKNDILKQAEASLSFFIGTINFSDSMAAAAMTQRSRDSARGDMMPVAIAEYVAEESKSSDKKDSNSIPEFNLYSNDKLDDAVSHANEITKT